MVYSKRQGSIPKKTYKKVLYILHVEPEKILVFGRCSKFTHGKETEQRGEDGSGTRNRATRCVRNV